MHAAAHHVIFRFRLPPDLLLRAPVGVWPHAARGVTVEVDADGAVCVTCIDHHMTYATGQVLGTAARFLARVHADAPQRTLRGFLSTPQTRGSLSGQPTRYSIALGAKVSITRVLIEETPVLVAAD